MVLQRLEETRRRRGFTIRELAARSGVSVPTISYLENAKHPSRPSTARKLAEALGVTVDHLMGGEPLPPMAEPAGDPPG